MTNNSENFNETMEKIDAILMEYGLNREEFKKYHYLSTKKYMNICYIGIMIFSLISTFIQNNFQDFIYIYFFALLPIFISTYVIVIIYMKWSLGRDYSLYKLYNNNIYKAQYVNREDRVFFYDRVRNAAKLKNKDLK